MAHILSHFFSLAIFSLITFLQGDFKVGSSVEKQYMYDDDTIIFVTHATLLLTNAPTNEDEYDT